MEQIGSGVQITSTFTEKLFQQGKSFSHSDYYIFGADEVKNFIFDGSALTGRTILLSPLIMAATSGPVTIDTYANVLTSDDGTLLSANNRKYGAPVPSVVLRLNPTITDPGVRTIGDLITSTGLNPSNSQGSLNAIGLPFEAPGGLKFNFKFTNLNGAGVYVLLKLIWFEL